MIVMIDNEDSKDNVDSMVLVYDMDNTVVFHQLHLIGYQQYIDLRDVKKVVPWGIPPFPFTIC